MNPTLINDKDTSACGGTAIALMREWQLRLYHPGVILNPVRDDLRMMASKPVAAKEGGMKEFADYIGLIMRLSSNRCWFFPG